MNYHERQKVIVLTLRHCIHHRFLSLMALVVFLTPEHSFTVNITSHQSLLSDEALFRNIQKQSAVSGTEDKTQQLLPLRSHKSRGLYELLPLKNTVGSRSLSNLI
jgi:hypothetical protein